MAATGYGGELTPNPDCTWVNLLVTLQTVASLMLDYSMLGIVYARCGPPPPRPRSLPHLPAMLGASTTRMHGRTACHMVGLSQTLLLQRLAAVRCAYGIADLRRLLPGQPDHGDMCSIRVMARPDSAFCVAPAITGGGSRAIMSACAHPPVPLPVRRACSYITQA